jgi:hypothetical protein
MNDGTQSLSGLPTFGPREILADDTVLPILECLGLREKWGNGTFATHHMINLLVATSFGDSDELTQEQYALITRNPHNFLDWLYAHRGAACVHEVVAFPAVAWDAAPLALPPPKLDSGWNPLTHTMMKRNQTERTTQENGGSLTGVRLLFDEGVIPWLRGKGATFGGLPSTSSLVAIDFVARALTYMDGGFLESLLGHGRTIASLDRFETLSGCPLVLIALDHGNLPAAKRLLELGAGGSITESVQAMFTDLSRETFYQYDSWLMRQVKRNDVFIYAVLPATLGGHQGALKANLRPCLRGVDGILVHIAEYAGVRCGPVMGRIREADSAFGFTMQTRYYRTRMLDQVADTYEIDRDYGRVAQGKLTATPEPHHREARRTFDEYWEQFLTLDTLLPERG